MRTRLQLPDFKGRPDPFQSLCDAVAKLPGVRRVEGRPATGSLIITHDGSTDELLAAAAIARLFHIEELEETRAASFEATALKDQVDRFLKETFGSSIDVRTVSSMAFIAMALRQLAAGNIMPPAATALWYGLSILLAIPTADAGPQTGYDRDGGE